MKVLHVITGINRGGAENHLLELVRHQRARGLEVSVAYLRGNGYWTARLEGFGAEVHNLGLRFYGDLRPLVGLRGILKRSNFDLVHAHLPPAELYSRLALLGTGGSSLPLLITKHNEERFCNAPGQRVLGRWVARRASRVIAISEAVKRYMAGSGLGIPAEKLETIYYGIDAAPFAPAAESLPGAAKELVIGFVGRLVPQKDIATLLRGFALFAVASVKARLVIVGEGSLAAELRRTAEELGISRLVVWAGFREDIAEVMRGFDIFALTSHYEGLGLVLLEAMAAGVAVAATRVGAIPEVVVEGETGLLVGPGQPEELAAAFRKLSDGIERARMGEAGRRRVIHRFTLERMWKETDDLYATQTLLSDAASPMLVFIIPIKSAKISRSWSLSNRLFERCLRSICNQTSANFRVVVVCNEKPEIQFTHPNIDYIEVDFPPPMPDPNAERTGGYEYGYSRDIARKNADKARKIHTGLDYAARYHPTHCMVVDADDCVSSRLAEFVSRHPRSDGWFFKKGYMYPEGGRFLYFNVKNFYQICGSSVIIAYGLTQALFNNPDYYEHTFDEVPAGTALMPLPFAGAVYSMANGDNIYMSSETKQQIHGTLLRRVFSRAIFSLVKKVGKYRPALLTRAIRREFGIYNIGQPSHADAPMSAAPQPG